MLSVRATHFPTVRCPTLYI